MRRPDRRESAKSLLRSEPQFRLSRSGQVGLASWDDVQAPTRGEFIRQQVAVDEMIRKLAGVR